MEPYDLTLKTLFNARVMGMEPDRVHARRVFEETLANVQQQYALVEDGIVEVAVPDAIGHNVIVARYKLYVDGHFECFEVVDEGLWPSP
jgi:hypothetical protein